jgi:hypothetical protein
MEIWTNIALVSLSVAVIFTQLIVFKLEKKISNLEAQIG